jgi:hypothetical protein
MIASADDLVCGAIALRAEATLIDLTLVTSASPASVAHLEQRRDALLRAAYTLDQQAKALQAVPA